MRKLALSHMEGGAYICMATVLDYEIPLRKCLSEITFRPEGGRRKILVDMALKCGANRYRFVAFDVGDEGKAAWGSGEYVAPGNGIVDAANMRLREHREIVMNSMLSAARKREILGA